MRTPSAAVRFPWILVALCAALLVVPGCAHQRDGGATLTQAAPERAGLSVARLQKLTARFDQEVANGNMPGAVLLVARQGQLAYAQAFGRRDPKAPDAMQIDSVFRIYSMTKPLASVAAMILVEDGVLQLTDPVSRWLPAFKDVKVSTPQGEVAPLRPMTVHDLLRHTAGLAYGELTQNTAVKDALTKASLYKPGVIDFDTRDLAPDEQVRRLAAVPLIHQPGSVWEYSLATDVLGRVIEAASGQRLGDFMRLRIFEPLKMPDTAFHLLPGQAARLAQPFDKDPVTGAPNRLLDVSRLPANDSGGSGCVSTAGDYLRFAQMLLNGGQLGGVRLLSPATVRWMTADHLGARIPPAPTLGGSLIGAAGLGFGLGFAVRPTDGLQPVPGSAGDYFWGGYAGTAFWIDPKQALVVVFMVQETGPLRGSHRNLLRQLVYQAIAE